MKKQVYTLLLPILIMPYVLTAQPVGRFEESAAVDEETKPVHRVPFASMGNTLQLAVANTSGRPVSGLSVSVEGAPTWMRLSPATVAFDALEQGTEETAVFSFDVLEEAPVGQPNTLTVTARSGQQVQWQKEIRLQVAAPAKFSLSPNYPNPFNPSTTIRYTLPARMKVTLSVYYILGRKVATLAEGTQPPGLRQVRFDGAHLASGFYFYRVVAEGPGLERIVQTRKMLLVK